MATRTSFDEMYAQLVEAWESHEQAKQGGDLAALYDSRRALDAARLALARHRSHATVA